jgi:hypothetical protein
LRLNAGAPCPSKSAEAPVTFSGIDGRTAGDGRCALGLKSERSRSGSFSFADPVLGDDALFDVSAGWPEVAPCAVFAIADEGRYCR